MQRLCGPFTLMAIPFRSINNSLGYAVMPSRKSENPICAKCQRDFHNNFQHNILVQFRGDCRHRSNIHTDQISICTSVLHMTCQRLYTFVYRMPELSAVVENMNSESVRERENESPTQWLMRCCWCHVVASIGDDDNDNGVASRYMLCVRINGMLTEWMKKGEKPITNL